MNRYDYLKTRAADYDYQLLNVPNDPNVFVMGSGKHWVGLSMSGLDSLQNVSEEKIKDLVDSRFKTSLKTLLKFEAA